MLKKKKARPNLVVAKSPEHVLNLLIPEFGRILFGLNNAWNTRLRNSAIPFGDGFRTFRATAPRVLDRTSQRSPESTNFPGFIRGGSFRPPTWNGTF
ncbi:uncharacterized protein METZ01_LOCUS272416 [marine metagenome]|uniref:Uncharacterized protein n=1 Tax=marine metagenome TaxID=408172 RepID=A0A382K840_9ZZZZ